MQVKIIYAGFKYDWGIQENGLYLSYIGTCRVIVLIVILPLGIKIFRRAAPVPSIPRPDGPAIVGMVEDDGNSSAEQKLWNNEAKYLKVAHDSCVFSSFSHIHSSMLTSNVLDQTSICLLRDYQCLSKSSPILL